MIQIFKDYEEFKTRQDKSINGVSQEWLDEHNLTITDVGLIRCFGCWNCHNCKGCYNCKNCIDCEFLEKCENLTDEWRRLN